MVVAGVVALAPVIPSLFECVDLVHVYVCFVYMHLASNPGRDPEFTSSPGCLGISSRSTFRLGTKGPATWA